MALLISEVYDAFKEAGVSEEKARKAAESLTGYITLEQRVAVLDTKVSGLDSKITWIGSTLIALNLLTLGGVITVLYRLATP